MADEGTGDGTGGEGADGPDREVDGPVFDEAFVRGATIIEADALTRARAKRQRKSRRAPLRAVGRFAHRNAPLLVAGALVIAGVLFGLRGQGPLGRVPFLRRLGGVSSSSSAASPGPGDGSGSAASSTSTSTTLGLGGVDYDPGSCITWDQSPGLTSQRETTEVPCDEPHLFEVTTKFDLDGSAYPSTGPTDEQWAEVNRTQCVDRASQFLGYALDPYGRYYVNEIKPSVEGWQFGQRTVQCGIILSQPGQVDIAQFVPFTGAVEGADQTRLLGTGTCIGPSTATNAAPLVDCATPHVEEVVGTDDLGPAFPSGAPYPSEDALRDAVQATCTNEAEQVYGGPLGPGINWGWYGLPEESWNTGRRVVECTLGTVDANWNWTPSPTLVRR